MNLFKRIMLVFYTFFLTVISAVFLILPFSERLFDSITEFMKERVYTSAAFGSKVIFFLIVAVFFMIGIMFLFSGIKRNKQSLAVTKATDLGEMSISLASIESLAVTSLKNTKGIKELKVDTSRFSDGVNIVLKLVVYPEVIITEMTKKIQSTVKSDVEAATGIKVFKVIVKVDNVTNYTMRSAAE